MSRVAEVKTRISSVELLATLKRKYSYKELSSLLGLSAPILSRYVRGHVLPSTERSEKFIALFRDKILKQAITESVRLTPDGAYDMSGVVGNIGLLGQVAQVVYTQFSQAGVQKILTMEVDGVPLAVAVAGAFNVGLAVSKAERELGIEEYYEQRVVYSPDSVKYLYLRKSSIRKGDHVLIVDDLVRSGVTIEALVGLAEKARAKTVGISVIAAMEGSIPKMKEKMGLNCPVESLLKLEQKPRHYKF
jgi:adenine phosphoribosyltransferase